MESLFLPTEIPAWVLNCQDLSDLNCDFLAGLEHYKLSDDNLASAEKPSPLAVIPANIPQELQEVPQWVCWRYEWDGKKWTKPPYQPNGYKANKMNPDHYSDFSEVITAYKKGGFSGIGFMLTADDPFVAIDIDHCLDGIILTDEAREIIKALNSYTEISPSGTGIRIFVKGTISRNIKKAIEIYSHSSYVTLTGQRWPL